MKNPRHKSLNQMASCLRPQIPGVELLQKLVYHRILCYVRLVRLLGAAAVLHHHVTDPSVDERALHPCPEMGLKRMDMCAVMKVKAMES